MTRAHEKLNYVEFAARDLAATKAFFQAAFGWQFADYGPIIAPSRGKGWMAVSIAPISAARARKAAPCWCSTAPILKRLRAR